MRQTVRTEPNVKDVVIAVTDKCNSRCLLCNIWMNPSRDELELKYFQRLPSNLRNIGISGGEPTLRDDLVDLIAVIRNRCKKAKLTFSTNSSAGMTR